MLAAHSHAFRLHHFLSIPTTKTDSTGVIEQGLTTVVHNRCSKDVIVSNAVMMLVVAPHMLGGVYIRAMETCSMLSSYGHGSNQNDCATSASICILL